MLDNNMKRKHEGISSLQVDHHEDPPHSQMEMTESEKVQWNFIS